VLGGRYSGLESPLSFGVPAGEVVVAAEVFDHGEHVGAGFVIGADDAESSVVVPGVSIENGGAGSGAAGAPVLQDDHATGFVVFEAPAVVGEHPTLKDVGATAEREAGAFVAKVAEALEPFLDVPANGQVGTEVGGGGGRVLFHFTRGRDIKD
jgi:hypothetical protein